MCSRVLLAEGLIARYEAAVKETEPMAALSVGEAMFRIRCGESSGSRLICDYASWRCLEYGNGLVSDMLSLHQPSSPLLPYVSGYWHVCDRGGAYRGRSIDTAPRPGAVLTLNIGRPNRNSDGALTPMVSLLGVQTQARSWRSDVDTDFIMALLTPLGLARLFPGCASGVANSLVDAGAVVGDRAAATLLNDGSARPTTWRPPSTNGCWRG